MVTFTEKILNGKLLFLCSAKIFCNSRFHALFVNEDNKNGKIHVPEISPKAPHSSNNRSSPRKENVTGKNKTCIRPGKRKERKEKIPVTVNLGDSLIKNVIGCELSDENNKTATKHFSGAVNNDMKSYMQPAISTLYKKRSFPLRISPVNVTKAAGNCGFGHIYWRNPHWKISFFVQGWLFLTIFS